jgi:iron(III) transport system ATP-binding protein
VARLELDRVSKTFSKGLKVLNDISLDVCSGEFVTLLGPSGCGKTTLLKAIAGFHSVCAGSFRIDGRDVTQEPPERRNTAMCFQSYALFPHLTVAENILFGPRQNRIGRAQCEERLAAALRQVDLCDHAGKLPSALSGGQQQRVALARSMAMRPGIILFDEPLSNLDAKLREQVRFEIRALQAELGFTAVYVTHDQAEALAMSDRIVVMNRGRIEQIGVPADVYDRPVNRFVADFIGAANIHKADLVSEVSSGVWRFLTEIGSFDVRSERRLTEPSYYIGWRPEDAEILPENGPSVNAFEATVEAQAFQGNLTDIILRSTRSKISCRIKVRRPLAPGSELTVTIAPDKLSVLEAVR